MRALAVAAMLALAGCPGPTPEVESVLVTRPGHGGRVVVTTTLRNRGRGDGQCVVELTLRDRATGDVVGRDEFSAELQARERITVSRDVVVPVDRDVVAEADARYPPD